MLQLLCLPSPLGYPLFKTGLESKEPTGEISLPKIARKSTWKRDLFTLNL